MFEAALQYLPVKESGAAWKRDLHSTRTSLGYKIPLGISGGRFPSGQVRQLGQPGVWEQRGGGSCQSPSSSSWLTQTYYSHWDMPWVSLEAVQCSAVLWFYSEVVFFFLPPLKLPILQTLQIKACKLRMVGSGSSFLLHARKKLSASWVSSKVVQKKDTLL